MPVYLPPVSRRGFLSGLIASVGSLAFRKNLAAEVQPASNRWALLADPHISSDAHFFSRGVNMADNLATVAKQVLSRPAVPGYLVVNGDCAYVKGELQDYKTFTGLLNPLRSAGIPIHLTLGNHDDRSHFASVLNNLAPLRHDQEFRYAERIETPIADWILLDSLDKTNSTPGELGQWQLQWLTETLDQHPDKPTIIVGHHNLEKPELKKADIKNGLRDSAELLQIIEPRQQVKAYIFGHTHHWSLAATEKGVHLINLPPVGYVFTKGDPSGWVLAEPNKEGLRLELRALDPQHPAHGRISELAWRS